MGLYGGSHCGGGYGGVYLLAVELSVCKDHSVLLPSLVDTAKHFTYDPLVRRHMGHLEERFIRGVSYYTGIGNSINVKLRTGVLMCQNLNMY